MTSIRLSLVLALAAPAVARADSAVAQAQVLFSQAKALVAGGKIAEGCAAFEASQKLDPATTTLVNLADCRDKNQQYASAWGMYLQVEREIRANADDSSAHLRELVTTRAAALAPRLSTVAIHVPADSRIEGLEILRDNTRVEPGAWNQALPVDGGTYHISARAPGHREWTTTIVVRPEHDAQSVDIPALGSTKVVPPPPAAPAPVVSPPPAVPSARPAYAPLAFTAGALVLGGSALASELSARSVYDDAKAATDRAHQVDLWDSANHRRYLATGLGLAAAGSAGVAIYLYVRDRRRERPGEIAITPVLTTASAGLAIGGAW